MSVRILDGDCRTVLSTLPAESVHCVVTSPPYFRLRDYGVGGQIGLEATPTAYVEGMVAVFREVRRVLRPDGTLWLNIGDSYSSGGRGGGNKKDSNKGSLGLGRFNLEGRAPKQLLGIPWRLAFALQADGWHLRQDIIWSKPNPMPESVTDRCTKAHEYLFLLAKSERYYFNAVSIRESSSDPAGSAARYKSAFGGKKNKELLTTNQVHTRPIGMREFDGFRNRRSVWTINVKPFRGAHFATFPPALVEPCIMAGCPRGGTVLDPFGGAGTTGLVASRLQRAVILIELNPEYAAMARRRIGSDAGIEDQSLDDLLS